LPDRAGKSVRFCRTSRRSFRPKCAKSRAPKNQFRERIQADLGFQSWRQKYCFPKIRNCGTVRTSRLDKRGVRVVTNVGRDAMDAEVSLTSGAEADGEIVWSWRRDAGVKSAIRSAGDGGKRARSPGSTYKPYTIAQGRPDQFGEPVVITLVCFFTLHARLRVHWAPGFPCALCLSRDKLHA
jgi:hypothetical protein